MRICISSVGSATAVNIIKLLKIQNNYNVETIGIDNNPYGYTSGSLLVDKFYQCPLAKDVNYACFIDNLAKTENIDVFIPIHDYEIYKVTSENIDVKVVVPSKEIINIFRDKFISAQIVESLGIKIPSIISGRKKDVSPEKIILRERIGVGSRGIQIIEKEDYIREYNNEIMNEMIFAQEYIDGDEYTVDVFSDKDGVPKLVVPRLRLEVKAGVATKVKLVNHADIIEMTKVILNKFPIPGMCNIQFIENQSGVHFIELNPRFGGMSISTSLASVNVLELFIDHFVCNKNLYEFDYYMSLVKWNSIITRYYEETIYYE